jgi:alpha-tubulin suppressor-like RCC1 family protein
VQRQANFTAVWTEEGELFTFGQGGFGQLGHGGQPRELVPRLVQALVGKKVIGASAGMWHTASRTEAGELFTFGSEISGGLGGKQDELGRGWWTRSRKHEPRARQAESPKRC